MLIGEKFWNHILEIRRQMLELIVKAYGEEWAAMLSTPTNPTAMRILFKRMGHQRGQICTKRERAFFFNASPHHVYEAVVVRNTSRAKRGVFHFRYYYVWVAWRSLELGSHLVPPATCLLALCSGPPSPTFKTPRKNIPRHHRNMVMTHSFQLVRSVLFNKIKIKNNWKIIMPTRTSDHPIHSYGWLVRSTVQHIECF